MSAEVKRLREMRAAQVVIGDVILSLPCRYDCSVYVRSDSSGGVQLTIH
jgi:hypothetical protein